MLPILFQKFGITIYSYPLFMGLAWGCAYYICTGLLDSKNLDPKGFRAFFWLNFLASWLGAKVFYLINSTGGYFASYLESPSFWLGGGFVFHGGLIFGMVFSFIYLVLLKKFSTESAVQLIACIPIGHAIGRIGCLLTGCCYGSVCKLPWSINHFGTLRHPVQAYEALCLFILGAILLVLSKKSKNIYAPLSAYLFGYGIIRFFLEYLRGDLIRGILPMGISNGQLISIGLTVMGIFLWFITKKHSRVQLPQ
ncbi:MAG: hypothetical protein HOE90_16975 [Bacteriovoracaceae bacterium]|jgi:phosphatidylglycerol---prolipoprotein diacylglyceryl transferase|nr:hypothetical protein [Bacteriovoracaceae bacterium]